MKYQLPSQAEGDSSVPRDVQSEIHSTIRQIGCAVDMTRVDSLSGQKGLEAWLELRGLKSI